MFPRSFVLLLTLGLAVPTAASAPKAPGAALRFMGGECDRLALAGVTARGCRPSLVNLVYASGAVSFVFAGRDGRLLSFRSRVEQQDGDQTTLSVEQVTIVPTRGAVWSEAAAGRCLLTPFAAGRSRVECSARADGQRFAAVFRTSDSKPRLMTLAAS